MRFSAGRLSARRQASAQAAIPMPPLRRCKQANMGRWRARTPANLRSEFATLGTSVQEGVDVSLRAARKVLPRLMEVGRRVAVRARKRTGFRGIVARSPMGTRGRARVRVAASRRLSEHRDRAPPAIVARRQEDALEVPAPLDVAVHLEWFVLHAVDHGLQTRVHRNAGAALRTRSRW